MSTQTKAQSIYLPEPAILEETRQMTETEKYFRIRLNSGRSLGHLPGQFVMVSVFGVGEAPISISSSPTLEGCFELVVRNAGNVTGAMHRLEAGASLGIRGPYGTHFPVDEAKGSDLLVVAGGLGLVPARSFINFAIDRSGDYGRIIILLGSRSPAERLFIDEIVRWKETKSIELLETVDCGDNCWRGETGVVTSLFSKLSIDPSRTVCVIVGPPVMYKFVTIEAKKKGIADDAIYMSLERRMKCGIGKCGHCQINNLYCCLDGPVFNFSQVKSLSEAL